MSQTIAPILPMPSAPTDNRFRVLVLDDDSELAAQVVSYIERTGFEVRAAFDSESGMKMYDALQPHLIMLRVSNGALDSHAFCRWVRDKWGIPVVMVGPDNEAAEIAALKIGADDYMSLPLRPAALLARVVAHLRRAYRYNTPQREMNPFGMEVEDDADEEALPPGWAECQLCGHSGPRATFEKEDIMGNIKMTCPNCRETEHVLISID